MYFINGVRSSLDQEGRLPVNATSCGGTQYGGGGLGGRGIALGQ